MTEASSSSSSFGIENNNNNNNAIDYHNKELGYIFSSSKVQATFAFDNNGNDEEELLFFSKVLNVAIHPSTPMGDEIILNLTKDDTVVDDVDNVDNNSVVDDDVVTIRLIIIKPNQDWRINQTYDWKLDNAWMKMKMKLNNNNKNNDNDWLHWNVQSYVNSVIQIPTNNNNNNKNQDDDDNNNMNTTTSSTPATTRSSNAAVFVTPHMEFHFNPILANGLPHGKPFEGNKLILKDVRLGAHLLLINDDDSNNSIIIDEYNPCKSGGGSSSSSPSSSSSAYYCSVVDGVTVFPSSTFMQNLVNGGPYYEIGEIVLAATLLSGAFIWVFYYIRYGRRTRSRKSSLRSNYEQVGLSEEEEQEELESG